MNEEIEMQMRNKKEMIRNGMERVRPGEIKEPEPLDSQITSPKKFTYLKKGQNTRKCNTSPVDSKRAKVAKPPQKSIEVLKK